MGGLSLLEIQYMYSDFNLVLKSELDDFKEIYNKAKTIFLAHVRKMHWMCFSNIYMPNTTKYQDNGYYVIYDCFNKGAKDCKTKDVWLGAFDLYIKKLFPQLEKRNFITVNINGRDQANTALIAFAYVVSLLEGKNPAEFEFEEDDVMIDHFNKCMKGRFFKAFPHSKHFAAKSVKYQEHKFKDQSQLKT